MAPGNTRCYEAPLMGLVPHDHIIDNEVVYTPSMLPRSSRARADL